MRTFIFSLALVLFGLSSVTAMAGPKVKFETSKGDFVLELAADKAPKTVENFLSYVKSGFYDGTIFHRVIPNFMIQGGGMTADLSRKSPQAPIKNEANNGLRNLRGTVAMARTGDPHSATAQFFINSKDNRFLDHTAKSSRGWGYTVFGKVIDGMDAVDAIERVRTTNKGGFRDVPAETVVINKAQIVE